MKSILVFQFAIVLGVALAEPWGRGGWGGRGGGWGWGRKRRSTDEVMPIETMENQDELEEFLDRSKRSAEPWGRGGWGGRGGGGWGWGRKRRSAEDIAPMEVDNVLSEENQASSHSKRSAEPWGRGGWGGRGGGGWGWGRKRRSAENTALMEEDNVLSEENQASSHSKRSAEPWGRGGWGGRGGGGWGGWGRKRRSTNEIAADESEDVKSIETHESNIFKRSAEPWGRGGWGGRGGGWGWGK